MSLQFSLVSGPLNDARTIQLQLTYACTNVHTVTVLSSVISQISHFHRLSP